MKFEIEKVGGIGEYIEEKMTVGKGVDAEEVTVYKVAKQSDNTADKEDEAEKPKVFLVVRKNTLEVRTDQKLRELLRERYESVMESRYFGRGGIEIVDSGQITGDEINDLVRLSYSLTKQQ